MTAEGLSMNSYKLVGLAGYMLLLACTNLQLLLTPIPLASNECTHTAKGKPLYTYSQGLINCVGGTVLY